MPSVLLTAVEGNRLPHMHVMLYLSIRAIVGKPKFMVAPSMAPPLREKDFFAAVKALALT